MKKKILSIFIFVLVVAISLTVLTGCPKWDGSKELRIGFSNEHYVGVFRCGAYSETDIFDIDNVTLDFYFGQSKPGPENELNKMDVVSIVFLFADAKNYPVAPQSSDGYQNIPGVYIMKEIPKEEFFTSAYGVDDDNFDRDGYSHHEKFTVPQELLYGEKAGFYFAIVAVIYDAEEGGYFFIHGGGGKTHANLIKYEKLESDKVRLSKGGRSFN